MERTDIYRYRFVCWRIGPHSRISRQYSSHFAVWINGWTSSGVRRIKATPPALSGALWLAETAAIFLVMCETPIALVPAFHARQYRLPVQKWEFDLLISINFKTTSQQSQRDRATPVEILSTSTQSYGKSHLKVLQYVQDLITYCYYLIGHISILKVCPSCTVSEI